MTVLLVNHRDFAAAESHMQRVVGIDQETANPDLEADRAALAALRELRARERE